MAMSMKWFEPVMIISVQYAIFVYIYANGLDTARTITFSIVGSCIACCNSLLYGVNKDSLIQLQTAKGAKQFGSNRV